MNHPDSAIVINKTMLTSLAVYKANIWDKNWKKLVQVIATKHNIGCIAAAPSMVTMKYQNKLMLMLCCEQNPIAAGHRRLAQGIIRVCILQQKQVNSPLNGDSWWKQNWETNPIAIMDNYHFGPFYSCFLYATHSTHARLDGEDHGPSRTVRETWTFVMKSIKENSWRIHRDLMP